MSFQGIHFDEFTINLCDWIHDTWGEVKFKFDEDKEENHCESEKRERETEVKEESQRGVKERKAKGKEESHCEGKEKEAETTEGYEKEVSRFKTRKEISLIYSESIR